MNRRDCLQIGTLGLLGLAILSHLGVDTNLQYEDGFLQIPQKLCIGTPVDDLV